MSATAPPPTTSSTTAPAASVRIGTRGSQLALWQATTVAAAFQARGARTEIVTIRTSGDRLSEVALSEAGGKRLFVKEIEDALLDDRVDVAVHSAKDMPTDMPAELELAAVLPRAEPWDALVLPAGANVRGLDPVLAHLGHAPRIGTSSIRRTLELRRTVPAAAFLPIRGNLDTRLRKLDEGHYDAIVLACAGLERLGAGNRISARLPLALSIPAPAQGAVAMQIRRDAPATLRSLVASADDRLTHQAVLAERTVVRVLGGGCQTPIGAVALVGNSGELELHAAVTGLDGTQLRASGSGPIDQPTALGERVGMSLLSQGAAEILSRTLAEGDGAGHASE